MDEPLRSLAGDLRTADSAVALTGAGVSTASGIPSFRGEDGIWDDEFDPESFHIRRFETDPVGFWEDRIRLREQMRPDAVEPNAERDCCQPEDPRPTHRDGEVHPPTSDTVGCTLDIAIRTSVWR